MSERGVDVMSQQYKNFISLGYFCEVAQDLEELGLRNTSSPFDWEISEFRGVMKAIQNNFEGFMERDNLIQSENLREHYYDSKYGIWFFHDFNKYETLDSQYPSVYDKYKRRITRFKKNITEPTLFFRYIENEPSMYNELQWVEDNYEQIVTTIKKFNSHNDIIFIGNDGVESDKFKIYHVKPEKNDVVSRHPIINNKELFEIVKNYEVPHQIENIQRFQKKLHKRQSLSYKLNIKIKNVINKITLTPYTHDKRHVWYKK